MMARRTTGLALTLVTATAFRSLHAQTPVTCGPTLTVTECFSALLGESIAPAAVRTALKKATTGAQTTTDVRSAIHDFVPKVGAALLTPGLSDDRQALELHLNQRSPLGTFQVGVEFPEPKLNAALLAAVPVAQRDAARERLEPRLDDQDDVKATLSLNAETRSLGRGFAQHAAYVGMAFDSLFAPPTVRDEAAGDALTDMVRLIGAERRAGRLSGTGCDVQPATDVRMSCFGAEAAQRVVATLREAAAALRDRRAQRAATLEGANFGALPQLLNNQPQLDFAFGYRYRGDLVGPDELTGTLRYEIGSANLNTLRRRCGATTITTACFVGYLTDAGTKEALARGSRFTLQVDLSWRAAYGVRIPDAGIVVHDDRSAALSGALGYGQYFGALGSNGTRRPRIDLSVAFERQIDGALRNDRLVGTAAYTLPIIDEAAGVLGVVWANKPEYVGDVDRRVTARLGLTYKLVKAD